ncbi:vacuolar protein sorting-associated protein 27 isoform X2 [Phoenix dactylifera]|uniref:Vacuolar protein sorting-associated protein 27 isoform X2 n=1 Tax=Phoenix dactylifera TaxID=42345 RepID=A0A8B8J2C7_PHODC|nr:vacuolar protein sorting-associated protein 27 isoform X2 [Phoenix dactylifera]
MGTSKWTADHQPSASIRSDNKNDRYQPISPHPIFFFFFPFSLSQVQSLLVLVVLPVLNLSTVGSEGREGDRTGSMSETPPPFQEAPRCDVCHCSFTTFRRRHHCRCCGRTLCHEHSSNQMALPQFGLYTNVRVCYDCFNKTSWSGKDDKQTSQSATAAATDAFSRLQVNEDTVSIAKSTSGDPTIGVPECKCGMPLCICEVPTPDPAPLPMKNSTVSTLRSNPRPKKALNTQQSVESVPKKLPSSSSSNQSSFFNLGQASNGSLDKGHADYDVSGEGLREAIKNSDATAVKNLLSKGVDANYCDKQGLSLLHLTVWQTT